MSSRSLGFAAVLCLFAVSLVGAPRARYDYYLTGNSADAQASSMAGGVVMEGGSTDVDEAFEWMISRAPGGDFVVIRASGADGYNQYVYDMGQVDSVESIVFLNREASFDPFVINTIRNAEMLFIAGGDQSNYVNYWKGTPIEDAIHFVASRNGVIGGTSAGSAVLGEFAFSALKGSAVSSTVLANPFHRTVTIESDFLDIAPLSGVITDQHFAARDRMGRLVTFLARIIQDGLASQAKGVAVDEQTALLVEPNGSSTVIGLGSVYFLLTPGFPEVCAPRTPLTYRNLSVYKASVNDTFDLVNWSGTGGVAYSISAVEGVLSSTAPGGDVY